MPELEHRECASRTSLQVPGQSSTDASAASFMSCRGLVVVGELQGGEQAAAARRIGAALGWPVAADVLSGEHHTLSANHSRLSYL